jgi:tetratricopeptide (TPR) repeat protein
MRLWNKCAERVRIALHWTTAIAAAITLAHAIVDSSALAQTQAPSGEPAAAAAPKKAKPKSKVAAKKPTEEKKDPAVAQQQIDAGIASLQAGKAEQAVQQFTTALTGGSLPSALMARAQYHRGLAYRKVNKPALAISDLTQALWLKNGLNETERADALQNRIAAYRDAGLPDQEDAQGSKAAAASKPATAQTSAEVASGSTGPASTGSIQGGKPTASLAPSTESATASPSSGLAGFFGNLFGGASASSSAQTAPASATPAPARTEVSASTWSAGVEVKPSAAAKATKKAAAAQPKEELLPWQKPSAAPAATRTAAISTAAAPTASGHGRYMLQVGQHKSAAEAETAAARLKQQLSAELAGREVSIVAVQAGGFGKLHRVSFGPFADPAEWKELCPKLLSAGHDCLPLAQ